MKMTIAMADVYSPRHLVVGSCGIPHYDHRRQPISAESSRVLGVQCYFRGGLR
jgi:hypothetical protein